MEIFFEKYLIDLKSALDQIDQIELKKIIEIIIEAKKQNRYVFLIGNGGSAATPSHSAGDWTKELMIKTIALTDNASSVTAFGNDTSYDNIFKGQLETFLENGDVLIGYSGSGNSPNVIQAVLYAKERGCTTIGITGNYKNGDGGKLKIISDFSLCVQTTSMEIIEDVHLIINHMIKEYIKSQIITQ
jgi:D-sedoheptulose 7-phosphate isomerase